MTPSIDERYDAQNGPPEPEPTSSPKTTEGVLLLHDFPIDSLVQFEFLPEPDLPDGLDGVARVVGVIEHVYDDGGESSGPHLSIYVCLVLTHEGETYQCHPEDGMTRLRPHTS